MWPGRTRNIQRPPIAKINALAHELEGKGRRLINLGQAVLGLPPPKRALQRVHQYLENTETHGYCPDPGLPTLREATASFLSSKKNIKDATASRVMLTCGANQAFVNALLAVTMPGDEVIIFAPYYFDHVFAVKLAGCKPVEVELAFSEGRYHIDFTRLKKALSPRTRVVVLVSPGNPTGRVADAEEIKTLCELCRRNDLRADSRIRSQVGMDRRTNPEVNFESALWLISDETYDLLTFPPAAHVSPAAICPTERTIVLGSFSKTFGLAAWRIGYLYGPNPEFIEETIKVQDALVVCAPVPSQMAALGALEEVDTYVPEAVSELIRRKDSLMSALKSCRTLEAIEPHGSTSVLARITTPVFEDAFAYSRSLLQNQGVITVPGSAFGPHGEGHVRLSFGNQPPSVIAQAGERIRSFENSCT